MMGLEKISHGISSKDYLGIAKAMYIPMTRNQKREYQQRIRDLVNKYKPKIEDKTKVNLEEISVRSYLKDINISFLDLHNNGVEKILDGNKNPNIFQKGLANILQGTFSGLTYPFLISFCLWRNSLIIMGAGDNCIRVPSGFDTRINLFKEKYWNKDLKLDQKVVHELSHILWGKIAGEDDVRFNEFLTYNKWLEGFATYCEQEYFLDIYPKEISITRTAEQYTKSYVKGKEKVKELVKLKGNDVILDIPKKWKEFEIMLQNKENKKC